ILDSYSAERVPVGEALLRSTKTATVLIALRNGLAPILLPVGTRLLSAIKPLKRKIERKVQRGMSSLALHYRNSPLTVSDPKPKAGGRCRPGDGVGWSPADEEAAPGWRELVGELADPRWTLLARAADESTRTVLEHVARQYGREVSVRTLPVDP